MSTETEQRLTTGDVARLWQIGEDQVLHLIHTRKLAAFKVGRCWRINPEAVNRYEKAAQAS